MEPFFLRCETCQARLRVRDERFLGQIQSCPKCGSMVQIIAPAGWLVPGNVVQESPPELTEVALSGSPSASTNAIAWLRNHAIASSVGTVGVIAACSLAAFLALRGTERVESMPMPRPAAEAVAEERLAPEDKPSFGPSEEIAATTEPLETSAEATEAAVETEASPELPAEAVAISESSASAFLPLITPPVVVEPAIEQSVASDARKLTLEPVEQRSKSVTTSDSAAATAEYPPAVETEIPADDEAATASAATVSPASPAMDDAVLPALDPPARRTNVQDSLALPIESITMPDVTIGEFVNFVSTMTAVPIELDAKVLGEVGLSSRTTVTVHGENTTAGKLLARVLKKQQLTCVERDGKLVVVRAKR